MTAAAPSRVRWLRHGAAAAVLVAAAVGVWWMLRRLDLSEVAATLRGAEPGWVVAAAGCGLAAQVTRALGWWSLLPVPVSFSRLVAYEFVAQASSAVSPEGSGELVRVGLLRREGVDTTTTLTLMVVRKFFSSLGLAPLLLLLIWSSADLPSWTAPVAVGYVLVLGVALGVGARISRRKEHRGTPRGRWSVRVDEVRAALLLVQRTPALCAVAGSSLLTRVLDLLALLLLGRALSLEVPSGLAVLLLLLVELSNVLPTAPGQLGTFDAAALAVLIGPLGGEDAAALTLCFHAQQLLPQAAVGALVAAAHLVHVTYAGRVASRRVRG